MLHLIMNTFTCFNLVVTYHIEVYLGKQQTLAKDATMYITLFGNRGDTGKRLLLKSLNLDDFMHVRSFTAGQVC